MGNFITDIVDSITGKGGRDAAKDASAAQLAATEKAIEFERESRDLARSDLAPFRDAGEGQLNSLVDLVNRPRTQDEISDIFNPASEVLSDDIAARAAAGGKLGSGNTLNDLFRSNMLLGEELREGRRTNDFNRGFNLVNMGQASAAGQANIAQNTGNAIADLTTQGGNAKAAGYIGAQNATNQGTNNLLALAAMAFSDRRLKRNITRVGEHKGIPTYRFQYLWSDDWYEGVMAQDVPHATVQVGDYLAVDYGAL